MSAIQTLISGYGKKDWGEIRRGLKLLGVDVPEGDAGLAAPRKRGRPRKVVSAPEQKMEVVAKTPRPPVRAGEEDFRIDHASLVKGELSAGNPPEKHTNSFVDSVEVAPLDRENYLPARPGPRRPPPPPDVKVTCAGCGKEEMVPPDLAPRPIEKGDTAFSYKCNRCLKAASTN